MPASADPGIAPEKLLRALLLQAFYSVRSERQLMEQIGYNLLFRWFVGLAMDAPVWDATTFSKNRDRLLDGDVAQRLLAAVVAQPRVRALMSDEHFSVDDHTYRTRFVEHAHGPHGHDRSDHYDEAGMTRFTPRCAALPSSPAILRAPARRYRACPLA